MLKTQDVLHIYDESYDNFVKYLTKDDLDTYMFLEVSLMAMFKYDELLRRVHIPNLSYLGQELYVYKYLYVVRKEDYMYVKLRDPYIDHYMNVADEDLIRRSEWRVTLVQGNGYISQQVILPR